MSTQEMANKGRERAHQDLTEHIPVFNKKAILFIFLTDFTKEEENAFLEECRLRYMGNRRELQAWKPSRRVLSSLAVQGTHRDSQANIYAIAMFAYRSGIQISELSEEMETKPATIFIVVDELSKRCWTNTHRVGEQGSISLIMVHVKSEPDLISKPFFLTIPIGVRVEVARYNDPSLWQDSESDDDSSNQATSSTNRLLNSMAEFQNGFHRAIYDEDEDEETYLDDFWCGRMGSWGSEDWSAFIYDPDRRPFASARETSSTRDEIWRALSPSLPPELVSNIISFTAANPSTEKILWKKRQSDEHLHLFLMFPTTEDELREISLIIHDLLQRQPDDSPKTAELIPLHCHKMISRRDILTFWEAYRQRKCVCRNRKKKQGSDWKWMAHPFDKAELLHHPDRPCYEVLPLWRGARSSDIVWRRWISVFYLTKRFTAKEDLDLRNEIDELTEEEALWFQEGVSIGNPKSLKSVCYVPWEHEEDGGLGDIWKTLLKVYKYQGLGTKCQRLFFIDRESFKDRRLIIVEAYFYLAGRQVQSRSNLLQGLEAPLLAGFRHCRIPAIDAYMRLIGLSSRNLVFEDLEDPEVEDENTEFIRPGWPSFSDLPPTNPFRPDWEEPMTIPVWEAFNAMGDGPNPNSETGTNP
ncbi:hypothetical protein N7540_006513 [Penicillium herquei]|nr:hypothetical protein N7540_006513 [Penicillium herquei]